MPSLVNGAEERLNQNRLAALESTLAESSVFILVLWRYEGPSYLSGYKGSIRDQV